MNPLVLFGALSVAIIVHTLSSHRKEVATDLRRLRGWFQSHI
jgi:hypothetical protein